MPLTLDLQIAKSEVIRGESILFDMVLANAGTAPVTLQDEGFRNRAFGIRVVSAWGFDASADTASMPTREGEHVDAPRKPTLKTLGPGEKITLRGDVISWIGELDPGKYTLRGTYFDSPPLRAQSKEVDFQVAEAAPVFARAARQNLPLAHEPRDTAWLHKTSSGFDLFLLRSSPKNCEVTYANVPIAHLTALCEPVPSSYNLAHPIMRHIVWDDGAGNLKILPLPKDAPAAVPFTVPLPMEDLAPIETPYSDEKGRLHVLLATPEGTTAVLVQLRGSDKPTFCPIETKPPVGPHRAALWCKDEVLVAGWIGPDEKEVYAVEIPLGSPPRPIVPRRVFSAEQPIINLLLAQRAQEGATGYDRVAVVLCHDEVNDIVYRKRIHLGSGEVEIDEKFIVNGFGSKKLYQAVLTGDLMSRYLFVSASGGVEFANASFSRFLPVLDVGRKPVRTASFPTLIVPTRFSTLPGSYVRYIDGRKRFVHVKVE